MTKAELITKIMTEVELTTKEKNKIPKIFKKNKNRVLKSLIRQHPYMYDELHLAAALGLSQAIVWAPFRLKEIEHFEKYIENTMRRFCTDSIASDHLIKVPRYAFRKRRHEQGEEADYSDLIIKTIPFNKSNEVGVYDTHRCFIDAFFVENKLDTLEIEIVWLLSFGYTVREIANKINKTKSTTSNIIMGIREKCKKK